MGECLISVDIECSGIIPGEFSMLSLGACLLDDPNTNFYVELKPISDNTDPKAMEIHGLSIDELKKTGKDPEEAMLQLESWVNNVSGDKTPVFLAWPIAFDWMFVHWYFIKFYRH